MTYLILLVLGLLIGAGFLVVLLIGDRKEARLEAQRKALLEQVTSAGQPVEGVWPPPPSTSALPDFALPATSAKTTITRASNRKMVRTFFQIRNAAIGTLILAYIIYSCFPRLNFGWVLCVTVLAVGVVWGAMTLVKKRRLK